MIADLGTVRFLDVWSFSGETILVLSKNLDQQLSSHSPRVLVCLQWSSAVNWFAILLSGVSVKDLYRDHFTVWYVSKSSGEKWFAQGLLSSMVSLFWSHSTAQV